MKVKAAKSFVARIDGKRFVVQAGAEVEMPKGVTWVADGLVTAVEPAKNPKSKSRKKKDS